MFTDTVFLHAADVNTDTQERWLKSWPLVEEHVSAVAVSGAPQGMAASAESRTKGCVAMISRWWCWGLPGLAWP